MYVPLEDISKISVFIVGYSSTEHIGDVIKLGKSLGKPENTLLGILHLAGGS